MESLVVLTLSDVVSGALVLVSGVEFSVVLVLCCSCVVVSVPEIPVVVVVVVAVDSRSALAVLV